MQKLNEEFEIWTKENTKEAMKKFADEYFTSNIGRPEIKDDPRNWHQTLQRFSKYKSNS